MGERYGNQEMVIDCSQKYLTDERLDQMCYEKSIFYKSDDSNDIAFVRWSLGLNVDIRKYCVDRPAQYKKFLDDPAVKAPFYEVASGLIYLSDTRVVVETLGQLYEAFWLLGVKHGKRIIQTDIKRSLEQS